jgi:RNA polymerase sigma-70 factor (sigma-E family)
VNGDEERAFREFVSTRSTALMRLGYLLTGGDQHEAEDLVQGALGGLARRWSTVTAPDAYVRQAMYRAQVSHWRRPAHRRELVTAEVPEQLGPDPADEVALRLLMREALASLTARQRAVLVLRYLEDLPEGEVAATLGISIGTVRSTAHRSLTLLRERSPALGRTMPQELTR